MLHPIFVDHLDLGLLRTLGCKEPLSAAWTSFTALGAGGLVSTLGASGGSAVLDMPHPISLGLLTLDPIFVTAEAYRCLFVQSTAATYIRELHTVSHCTAPTRRSVGTGRGLWCVN